MANYDDDINKIEYSKKFTKDPSFEKVLSDTSIDSKVTMTKIHKNINSLSGELEKSRKITLNQFKGLSSSISTTANQQKKLVQQIRMKELASSKQVKIAEKSIQQVLGKLGYTINVLGTTSKKVLLDTAKATKETMREYTQAISADFAINKTNFLSMTLAKASPIFGYFAGKFMETSVFKNFTDLIKTKMGLAVTFVSNKMKDIWGRIKSSRKRRKEEKLASNDLPKLQTGGYVKKTGAVQVHAAEVVAPLNKLSGSLNIAFSKALIPMNQNISQLLLLIKRFSSSIKLSFKKVMSPLNIKMQKIVDYIKWSSIASVASAGYSIYKLWQQNRYSSKLSKNKDPKMKLAEDFSNYYTLSLEKLDNIYNAILNKKTKRTKNKNKNKEINKNIKKISDNLKEDVKIQTQESKILKKIKSATEGSEEKINKLNTTVKKSSTKLTTWVMIAFGFLKNIFSSVTGLFKNFGSMIANSSLGRMISGGFGRNRGAGKGTAGKAGKLSKFGKFGKLFKVGGGILSAASLGMDMWEGIGKSDEWETSKTSSAIGSALGGTEGGGKGALFGMAKGAAVGMMFGPIGAGIGALAGGLLGLVGGKNIAKGLDWIWKKVEPLISSITDVLMFPFKILMDLKDRFMKWFDDPKKTMFDRLGDIAKVVTNLVTFPSRLMIGLTSGILQKVWGIIPDFIKKAMPDFVVKGVDDILSGAQKLSKGFEDSFGGGSAVENTANAVKTVGNLAWNVAKGGATSVGNIASSPFKYAGEKINNAVTEMGNTETGKKIKSGVQSAAETASAVKDKAIEVGSGIAEKISGTYQDIIQKLKGRKREFVESIGPAAQKAANKLNVPVEAILSQAGVESGWGTSSLTKLGNNYFGMKMGTSKDNIGPIEMRTREVGSKGDYYIKAKFAKYRDADQQFSDYAAYIARKYPKAVGAKSTEQFVSVLKAGGYATDPKYVSTLSGVSKNLTKGLPVITTETNSTTSTASKPTPIPVPNKQPTSREKGITESNTPPRPITSNDWLLAKGEKSITESNTKPIASNDWLLAKGEKGISESDTPPRPITSNDWLLAKGEKGISDVDEGPSLTKKDVAKFEATKEIITSEMKNINTDKLKESLEMLNKTNQNSMVVINNLSNNISSSLSNMANSLSGGNAGSLGQAGEALQKLLTGDV